MTLWVFGDSYTADGRKTIGSNNWQHIENTWVELLTKKLNVSNNNVFAIPGVSNEWLYGKLLQEQNNFQPGDYIIIQPTCATRRWLIERCPELANWQHLSANNKFLTKDEVSALDSFRRYLINEQVELYNYDMFIRAVMFISQNLVNNRMLIIPGFHNIPGIVGSLGDICFGEFVNSTVEDKYYRYHKNDPRINHMHEVNHRILAQKIHDFFKFGELVDLTAGFNTKFITEDNYKQNICLTS